MNYQKAPNITSPQSLLHKTTPKLNQVHTFQSWPISERANISSRTVSSIFFRSTEHWAKHRRRGPLTSVVLFGLLTYCYLPVAALSILVKKKDWFITVSKIIFKAIFFHIGAISSSTSALTIYCQEQDLLQKEKKNNPHKQLMLSSHLSPFHTWCSLLFCFKFTYGICTMEVVWK